MQRQVNKNLFLDFFSFLRFLEFLLCADQIFLIIFSFCFYVEIKKKKKKDRRIIFENKIRLVQRIFQKKCNSTKKYTNKI
jgi:hypothetical protein